MERHDRKKEIISANVRKRIKQAQNKRYWSKLNTGMYNKEKEKVKESRNINYKSIISSPKHKKKRIERGN